MEQGALTAVGNEERVVAESELKKAQERISRLERLLGQKTEEVEILKEAVRIGREKKLISRKPLEGLDDFECRLFAAHLKLLAVIYHSHWPKMRTLCRDGLRNLPMLVCFL